MADNRNGSAAGQTHDMADKSGSDGYRPVDHTEQTGTGDKTRLIHTGNNGPDITPDGSTEMSRPAVDMSPLQIEGEEAERSRKKTQEGLKIIILSSVLFAVSVTIALILTIFLGPPPVTPHGAVACDSQECADIGVDMLKRGGSATDAAVAALLCLGVIHPHHSGIGGGSFMLLRSHDKNSSLAINARETAPSSASNDMFQGDENAKTYSPLAVGLPGELRGLEIAHGKFGKLSWEEVVMPAVNLAREGFNVSALLAHAVTKAVDPDLPRDARLREIFFIDGVPVTEGQLLKRPDLAEVLQTLASHGVEHFYETYGQEISDATGGHLTVDDLLGYKAQKNDTLKGRMGNQTVETMPAPGGGPLLLLILNVMQNFSLSDVNRTDPLYYHRLVETLKFMEAERYNFGDTANAQNLSDLVTSSEYAAHIRSLISDDGTQEPSYYMQTTNGAVAGTRPHDSGTAHVSVIGPNEDFVSATSSVNMYFGSHIVTKSGIILNNQMADFDSPDSSQTNQPNLPAPGKHPMSSMTPTLVHMNGKPCSNRLVLGGVNGSRIIAGVAQVLINMYAFDMNLTQAIEAARINDPLTPDQIEYDQDFSPEVLSYLQSQGHTHQFDNSVDGLNYVHAVAKVNETVEGHSDSREEGSGASVY